MPSLIPFNLRIADAISNSVIAICKARNFAPVTVVVMNQEGREIVTKRMDGCSPVGIPQFAFSKANTCISMKMGSRTFAERYTNANPVNPAKLGQMLAMTHLAEGKLAPFPGGVLIKNKADGAVVGAIGVSGAAGDEDEFMALTAILDHMDPNIIETDPIQAAVQFR